MLVTFSADRCTAACHVLLVRVNEDAQMRMLARYQLLVVSGVF